MLAGWEVRSYAIILSPFKTVNRTRWRWRWAELLTYLFKSKGCWFKTVNRMRWIWIGCASGVVLMNSHTSTAPSRGFSVTGWYQVRLPRVAMMGPVSGTSNSWSSNRRRSALWKPKVGTGTTESLNAFNASSSPTLSASGHATTWLKVRLHTMSVVVIRVHFQTQCDPFWFTHKYSCSWRVDLTSMIVPTIVRSMEWKINHGLWWKFFRTGIAYYKSSSSMLWHWSSLPVP